MKPQFSVFLLCLALTTGHLAAQDKSPADHPAAKVVGEFLPIALERDWNKAAKFIEPTSLANLQRGWVAKTKRAATIDEEKALVRSIGKEDLDQIEKMSALDFYAAYQISLQNRFNLAPERLKIIADTIKLEFLSVGQESDRLCHVLVRTHHQDGTNNVSRLELISLVKSSDKWRVSLDEQTPKITPIKK